MGVRSRHGDARREQLRHRQRLAGPDGIEDAGRARLQGRDRPGPEVPRVDELDGLVRLGGEDGSTARHAPRPVDEALGVVVWPHDEAGSQDKRPARESCLGAARSQSTFNPPYASGDSIVAGTGPLSSWVGAVSSLAGATGSRYTEPLEINR